METNNDADTAFASLVIKPMLNPFLFALMTGSGEELPLAQVNCIMLETDVPSSSSNTLLGRKVFATCTINFITSFKIGRQ
jgi:hypothetical protein